MGSQPDISLCPLVARESEREALVRLWRSSRLVTLYGQSGVGKSALALAAADQLAEETGCCIVYRDAGHADGVFPVLRLLAGVRRRGCGSPQDPRSAPLHVLLDDLPVAAHGAAHGLLQWLVTHPDAHLLVVSRRPLQLIGEQTLPLRPLAVSATGMGPAPAVQCFQYHARRAHSAGPAVGDGAAAAIAAGLDGLPAALEAAAALVGALPESEIVRIAREAPLSLTLRETSVGTRLAATLEDLPPSAREFLLAPERRPGSLNDPTIPHLCGPDSPPAGATYLLQLGLLEVVGHHPELRYHVPRLVRLAIAQSVAPLPEDRRERRAEQSNSSGAAPALLIRLLGPLGVEGPAGVLPRERLRPKEQRVLARLALEPGQLVPRDELLELFWPHSHPQAAERSLRTVVSSLRAGLRTVLREPSLPLITGRMEGYLLEAPVCSVDVAMFNAAIREARAAAAEPERALAAWQLAVDMYDGDLLCHFPYDDWCLGLRERLRVHLLDGLYQLARAALSAVSLEQARDLSLRMVGMDPAEERAHRLLMRCYARMGSPGEAVRQFERCREALWEELGAQPARTTLRLYEAIRSGAPALWDEGVEEAEVGADWAVRAGP